MARNRASKNTSTRSTVSAAVESETRKLCIEDGAPAAKRIALTEVEEDPQNERQVYGNLEGLAESIKSLGLVEPLVVTCSDGKYTILSGHRRFRAAKLAGLDRVDVVVRKRTDEFLRRRQRLVCNLQRESLNPVELAEAFESLLVEDGQIKTQRQLAAFVGKDRSWVCGILKILSLKPELRKTLESSLSHVPYDTAIRIARVHDAETQAILLKKAIQGATNAEMREEIASKRASRTKRLKFRAKWNGCTAIVAGPQSSKALNDMQVALAELVRIVRKHSGDPMDFSGFEEDEEHEVRTSNPG